jgi:hypothetical protein
MAAINACESGFGHQDFSRAPSKGNKWMKTRSKTNMPSTHRIWQLEVPQISIL